MTVLAPEMSMDACTSKVKANIKGVMGLGERCDLYFVGLRLPSQPERARWGGTNKLCCDLGSC